jgi:hypothetical protein
MVLGVVLYLLDTAIKYYLHAEAIKLEAQIQHLLAEQLRLQDLGEDPEAAEGEGGAGAPNDQPPILPAHQAPHLNVAINEAEDPAPLNAHVQREAWRPPVYWWKDSFGQVMRAHTPYSTEGRRDRA